MEEFDFSIEHRAGSQHANADALSRRPCRLHECACKQQSEGDVHLPIAANKQPATDRRCLASHATEGGLQSLIGGAADQLQLPIMADPVVMTVAAGDPPTGGAEVGDGKIQGSTLPWSLEGLRDAQRGDPEIACVIHMMEKSERKPEWESVSLASSDVKKLWVQWPRLAMRDGLLRRRFKSADGLSVSWQVVLPAALRTEFLQVAHGGMTGGHLGRRRTAATVQARAYWPSWSTDLDTYLKQCIPCARYHRGKIPKHVKLQPFPVGGPWERVSIDITGPHPKSSHQNEYILTCVDHFSKWAEAIPLRNNTAPTVARALMTHVFSRFGAPCQLLSDRAPEFESELFQQLMRWMEIDKLRTTAYQPSTNGAVERFHRTLNRVLGKVISDAQRD